MRARDRWLWGMQALRAQRLRSGLSMLGIAIGIGAVILLTSIGEGARRFVMDQFLQFGTNLITVTPGKTETTGLPGVLGGTTRKLTVADAQALERLDGVESINPHTHGLARVERGAVGRDVGVFGGTAAMLGGLKMRVVEGTFLPPGDPRRGANVVVLGATLKRELFGRESAVGQVVRVGSERFRVIGVLAAKGKILTFDMDDTAFLPLATHMRLFNRDEIDEVNVSFRPGTSEERLAAAIRGALRDRHDGVEDFTLTTQAAMLGVFDRVLGAVTATVGAIAGVSLVVGALGILTVMWIAVGERTGEIGLLRALGARQGTVLGLFLIEAVALSLAGGVAGLVLGLGVAAVVKRFVPALPFSTPLRFVVLALLVSLAIGLMSGVWPARRAARLDPIEALRAE